MVFDRIEENDRRTVVRHVDDFCMYCGYLYPEADDPCEGCKMQEFVDSLNGREPQESTWIVTVSEHRKMDVTVAATDRREAIRIVEGLLEQGRLEDHRMNVERHYEACAVDMAPASDAFSLKDIE